MTASSNLTANYLRPPPSFQLRRADAIPRHRARRSSRSAPDSRLVDVHFTARSATTLHAVSASWRQLSSCSVSVSLVRHSMPTAPWPPAGRESSKERLSRIRPSSSKRFKPAAARMIASYPPASNFDSRVPTLPRKSVIFKSGRSSRSWHWRRKLEVPTVAPWGRSASLR